ncbi:MAG: hypothetical protein RBS57_19765 [Desulforhabdus sp.]|jgi:hypothetical protein|nr:hypothetical protein [Desulforhabdus sp.]
MITIGKRICFAVLVFGFIPHQTAAAGNISKPPDPIRSLSAQEAAAGILTRETQTTPPRSRRANFDGEAKSQEAQNVADWVVDSGDNQGLPFVIVDKVAAKVFVFDADGRLRGAAPALLGLARGDKSIHGIGERQLSDIRPEERTTPAGRFLASLGYNSRGKDVLWVDYDSAVSLHRVITNNPVERRLQRLSTRTPLDNRISYGCINVPVKFYDHVVIPTFTRTHGIVYVLPEILSNSEVFALYYDVEAPGKGLLGGFN